MKKTGTIVVVIIAGIGLFLNMQKKNAERAAKRTAQTEDRIDVDKSDSSSAEGITKGSEPSNQQKDQKDAYEAANQAFIQAYFNYGSYEERQKHSQSLLTEAANKEVQLSIYDPNEQVQSIVIDSSYFYKEETEDYVVSLNEIQLSTKMNELPSKLSMVYRFTLVHEKKTWKIDSVTFIGSRTL